MKKNIKVKTIISLLINLFIVVSTTLIAYHGIRYGASEGQLGAGMKGLGYFKAFTIDSNILFAIASLFMLFFNIKTLIKKKNSYPNWIYVFKYMGAVSVALTFIVVIFFLAPYQGIKENNFLIMFQNDMLFFHLINPLLAIISNALIDNNFKITVKERLISLIPMIIYSVIYAAMVAVLERWDDFYHFTFNNKFYLMPFILIGMYIVTYIIAYLLSFFRKEVK